VLSQTLADRRLSRGERRVKRGDAPVTGGE
jgi:hypothetical protein